MNMLTLLLEKDTQNLGEIIQNDFKEYSRITVESTLNALLLNEIETFFESALAAGEEDYRNGYYYRTIHSSLGDLEIKMPRDRANLFKNTIFKKYQRSFNDINDLCIDLFTRGLTLNEIVDHLEDYLGETISRETIRKTALSKLKEAISFNTRKLPRCVFVFLDGTYVSIKRSYDNGPKSVEKECVEVALGITEEGKAVILGYYFIPNEGATSWKENLIDLKNRGIGDPKLFITDGLNGIEEAISSVFPNAAYQTCIVHICRNIMKHARKSDRKEIANDFMEVFHTSNSKEEAETKLEAFINKWSKPYPRVMDRLQTNNHLFSYMVLPKCLWKGLYTSNRIEGFNAKIKRATRKKILLNSEDNAIIVLTNCCISYNKSLGIRQINGYSSLTIEEKEGLGFIAQFV